MFNIKITAVVLVLCSWYLFIICMFKPFATTYDIGLEENGYVSNQTQIWKWLLDAYASNQIDKLKETCTITMKRNSINLGTITKYGNLYVHNKD